MKNKRLWLIVIALVAIFGGAYWLNQTLTPEDDVLLETTSDESAVDVSSISIEETSEETSVQEESESFELVSNVTYSNQDGELIELHDQIGKPMIINVWASWCPPCRDEMPIFEKYYEEFGDQVDFVMLNATGSRASETKEESLSFIDEMGLNLPIYFDEELMVQSTFGIRSLPTTILVNEKGEMVEYFPGQVSNARLKQFVNKLIGE